jgi:hypothetical protein
MAKRIFGALMAWTDTVMYFLMSLGMPSVYFYHQITDSPLINVAAEDAVGLEKAADIMLVPTRYLLAGKRAVLMDKENHQYCLVQEHQYRDRLLWHKTAAAGFVLPVSFISGSALKSIAMLNKKTRKRRVDVLKAMRSDRIVSNLAYYEKLGLEMTDLKDAEFIFGPKYERRPGDEKNFPQAKEALKEIVRLLHEAQIPFWLDCGSCLGAYRYGGIIPWDNDIDIAILQPDFDNVKAALQKLDPQKYMVQDWSSRDKPGTYLKVYVRESRDLIDIYHYAIDEQNRRLYTIVSNEDCIFLPESWKVRERYTAAPVSFETIFPLKKTFFDGIEVFVPNRVKEFLQSKYGEDISPVKIYSEVTRSYEKDVSHPYWQREFAR